MTHGLCVVITGATASGKTTVVRHLLGLIPESVRLVTMTSRAPRPTEREGFDYHFVDRADFERRAVRGEFLEFEENYGNFYGSSRVVLDAMTKRYPVVFAVLDPRGARTYKEVLPETVTIFLRSPIDQVRGRLKRRKGAQDDDIERRLDEIRRENDMSVTFDYVVDSFDGEMETVVAPAIRDILIPLIPTSSLSNE